MRFQFPLLMASMLVLGGCGQRNEAEIAEASLSESPLFVDITRPVEDLRDQEQIAAYEWAQTKVLEAIQKSKIADAPGASDILTALGSVDLGKELNEMRSQLDTLYSKFPTRRQSAGINLMPKAFIPAYLGVPASASAKIGMSGALSFFVVTKLFKVTRIDKRTGRIASEFWKTELSLRGSVKAGVGVGAGGGVGIQGGVGFVWGELDHAEDFQGFSVSVNAVPLAGGVGPVIIGGGLWNNVTELSKAPKQVFLLAGLETGMTAKALESHVQVSGIGDVWGFFARMLDLGELEESQTSSDLVTSGTGLAVPVGPICASRPHSLTPFRYEIDRSNQLQVVSASGPVASLPAQFRGGESAYLDQKPVELFYDALSGTGNRIFVYRQNGEFFLKHDGYSDRIPMSCFE